MGEVYENYKNNFIKNEHFFCISHFNGNIEWISNIGKNNYIIYNKSGKNLPKEINHINIKNVGYNLYSYLKFIIDNYNNLPSIIVFCKDNVFSRHVDLDLFKDLLKRNTFTTIEENLNYYNFPVVLKTSDYGFTEINSSWYKNKYPRMFFKDFNCFYQYIFKNVDKPHFLRFAPGANYIVPRENILLRSRNFYRNLLNFIIHSQYSCESHFLERSLYTIWNSNLESSEKMDEIIDINEMEYLKYNCINFIKKENIFKEKVFQKIAFIVGNAYMQILLKNSIK